MRKPPGFLFALPLACLCLGGCRDTPPVDPPVSTLVVGMDLSHPPFETRDDEGVPRGLTVDLLRDLGTYLNVEVKIEPLATGDLVRELSEKRIDLFVSPPPFSPEPGEGLLATEPYAWVGLALLTGSGRELASAEDLNHSSVTVAVLEHSAGQVFASTSLPRTSVKVFDREDSGRNAVLSGEVDALILDQIAVYRLAEEKPDQLRAVLEPFRREPRVFYLRKEDESLRDDVNDFIEDYREIGGFDRLLGRHLPDLLRDFQDMGEVLPFDIPEEP